MSTRKSGQISVGDKIVSRDGVSSRTTGNLQLTGDYEEFGEVQEKRVIEGEGITIHADVFGNIVSRGGTVLLNRNLVGGTAHNARGDISVKGVASGAVIQASCGEVVMNRAESCIISGTRVTVEHAVNCEIIADEVEVKQAEGCAIAGRRITIESAGPRKQSEMLVYALRPDSAQIDEVIKLMTARVDEFGALAAQRKAEMDQMTSEPEVRKYVMLASKIRKKELTLTPEQVPQFQKMALAVGPALKAIAKVSLDVKAAETEQQAGQALVAQLMQQRSDSDGVSQVAVRMVQGDTHRAHDEVQPGRQQHLRPAGQGHQGAPACECGRRRADFFGQPGQRSTGSASRPTAAILADRMRAHPARHDACARMGASGLDLLLCTR